MAEKEDNAYDLQLRLGFAASPTESSTGKTKQYACSHCRRTFVNLQALGGHQTAHRKEMEELQRSYVVAAPSVAQGANVSDDGSSVDLRLRLQPAGGSVDLNLKL